VTKRKHARVVVQRRVTYRHAQGQGEGMLLDLSLQGCRIKGAPPFSCGTRLRLQLWLPDQAEPVAVEQAVVRWVKADEFGVSFQDVPPDVQARLAQVFQILHETQQPKNKVISIPAFAHYDGAQSAAVRSTTFMRASQEDQFR
jgi:hypothetical protein